MRHPGGRWSRADNLSTHSAAALYDTFDPVMLAPSVGVATVPDAGYVTRARFATFSRSAFVVLAIVLERLVSPWLNPAPVEGRVAAPCVWSPCYSCRSSAA